MVSSGIQRLISSLLCTMREIVSYRNLQFTIDGAVGGVTLNRPTKRNALLG